MSFLPATKWRVFLHLFVIRLNKPYGNFAISVFSKFNFMKKFITLIAIVFCFASYGMAQTTEPSTADSTIHHQHSKTKTAKPKKDYTSQLGLDQSQQKKISAYNQQTKQKQMDLLKDTSLTSAQKAEQMQNLKRENKRNISSVLTPEQQAKLKDLKGQKKKQLHTNPKTEPQTKDTDSV